MKLTLPVTEEAVRWWVEHGSPDEQTYNRRSRKLLRDIREAMAWLWRRGLLELEPINDGTNYLGRLTKEGRACPSVEVH